MTSTDWVPLAILNLTRVTDDFRQTGQSTTRGHRSRSLRGVRFDRDRFSRDGTSGST